MDEQDKDVFFDELRSLARKVEKGRHELQESLDADIESTEQLDNLRNVLADSSSLKEKYVNELSATNSSNTDYSQALSACRNTMDRCRQGLDEALTFLEQYGYDRESAVASPPLSPTTAACATTPTPAVSNMSRAVNDASSTLLADGSTPTLERAGISTWTLAALRRGAQNQTMVSQTPLTSAVRSTARSAMTPRAQPPPALPSYQTPRSLDLDQTLAELNIESVHVLGPRHRTADLSSTMVGGRSVVAQPPPPGQQPYEPSADNTVAYLGQGGYLSSLQTPLPLQSSTGIGMSSTLVGTGGFQSSQPGYHGMSDSMPYSADPSLAVQPTPLAASAASHGHSSAFSGTVHSSAQLPPHQTLDMETPRPSAQASSTVSHADLSKSVVTPSVRSAFNSAPRQAPAAAESSLLQNMRTVPPALDPGADDIPMPELQGVALLPPKVLGSVGVAGASSFSTGTGVLDSTLTSSGMYAGGLAGQSTGRHNTQSATATAVPQIRPITEAEFSSMPEYIRFLLTFELITSVVTAINHLVLTSRGDIPAGQFSAAELRDLPGVGDNARCAHLLLSKVMRIQRVQGVGELFAVL